MDFLFNPAWATVFIAVATAALLLDKFFGFSTAWIRYITSQMKIQYLLEKFEYDWMEERASWKGQKPDYAQVKKMIAKCAAFSAEVSKIEENETLAWTKEFSSALQGMEQTSQK